MTRLDHLLAEANPVPDPPAGHVTSAQERLLSTIVAAPRPRRRADGIKLLMVASAVVAVALAIVLVVGRGAGVNDEVEVTAPSGGPTIGEAELIHVVTRLYGTVYGPGLGERLDGWLQPSTGRARIVITTGDGMTLQEVVGADDRVRTWQGGLGNANGMTQDLTDPAFADTLRAEVRDRMAALVKGAKNGFREDSSILDATTTDSAATTESGEYRGRAVTIHRIAPKTRDGKPSGYYFKWYSDPDTGGIVAFERGPVGDDGKDIVDTGEELEKLETFPPGQAPLHELDWQQPPVLPPTATPSAPTPTPARSQPTPTPAP